MTHTEQREFFDNPALAQWAAIHEAMRSSRHGDRVRAPGGHAVDNFHGFKRYREPRGRWRFNVTGFIDDFHCSVETVSGGKQAVRIDLHDRIEIAGRWYSHLHWSH